MSATRLLIRLRDSLAVVHRWLGVALCVPFLMWFASGIVMMYWDFPGVLPQDRLARSPALEGAAIHLSWADAAAKLGIGSPDEAHLNTFDGRPVYRFRSGSTESKIYADTGERQVDVPREMMRRIAAAWSGQPAAAARETAVDVDQWTIQGQQQNARPLWQFSWPDGQQVYVSQRTGEVVQYTTSASRLAAYLGAIPHWLYFTPLRRNHERWVRFMTVLSGIATIGALLGLTLAIWAYSPSKGYRHDGARTAIPYRGWLRWHVMAGLIVGVGALTWAFSGWVSLDPLPRRTVDAASAGRRTGQILAGALRGRISLETFAAKHPREALAELNALHVQDLELTSILGEPLYLATLTSRETRIVPIDGPPAAEIDRTKMAAAVADAARLAGGAIIDVLDRYDRYYRDHHRKLPLPVILARVNDADHTRFYIDPKTARIVGSYSSDRWVERWLYHGLHSLDFPWLYEHRSLWDIIVIAWMVGGSALAMTALILVWRVLGRTLGRAAAASAARRGSAAALRAD